MMIADERQLASHHAWAVSQVIKRFSGAADVVVVVGRRHLAHRSRRCHIVRVGGRHHVLLVIAVKQISGRWW